MGYRNVVHFDGNDGRGIDVCLVSRVPVGPVTSYRHLRFVDRTGADQSFRRDLLRVQLEPTDGDPFEVWVVHLKSKSGGEEATAVIRHAEATQIRKLLDERLIDMPQTRFVLCGDFNDTFDSEAVQIVLGEGTLALHSFVQELPEEDRVTYNRKPHLSMIDFLFASPAMARDYVSQSYRIYPGDVESAGSDHNPVVGAFHWRHRSE